MQSAPPPTRGWTLVGERSDLRCHGSPAHAGMDRSRSVGSGTATGLPRPRGDGPAAWTGSSRTRTAPPPTRGWTVRVNTYASTASGSPAHAGMDRCGRLDPHALSRLPRPRGDGPLFGAATATVSEAPPPTRGWTRLLEAAEDLALGSPAHAGMDPRCASGPARRRRLPRPRGDGPWCSTYRAWRLPAPPPTRGWTLAARHLAVDDEGSPAHAGMDPLRRPSLTIANRLPRPRGDGPSASTRWRLAVQAPPPTRGWTPALYRRRRGRLGSPAHAGMDRTLWSGRARHSGLPRPRGDGPLVWQMGLMAGKAPPPTRGWTPHRAPERDRAGGSPAHAGMDRTGRPPSARKRRLPRPRGDGPQEPLTRRAVQTAPPPTRGWTQGQ